MNARRKQISVLREASRSKFAALSILAVCLTFSCRKIEPVSSDGGALKLEPTKFADAIPDEFGPLIGVTQNAQNPEWAALWFQKPDKTITAVFVHIGQGKIYEKTLTIPRK
jgi:hypothetical protein